MPKKPKAEMPAARPENKTDRKKGPFCLVWKKNGRYPRRIQPERETAFKEAERLAAFYPGSRFYVLEKIGAVGEEIKKEKGE